MLSNKSPCWDLLGSHHAIPGLRLNKHRHLRERLELNGSPKTKHIGLYSFEQIFPRLASINKRERYNMPVHSSPAVRVTWKLGEALRQFDGLPDFSHGRTLDLRMFILGNNLPIGQIPLCRGEISDLDQKTCIWFREGDITEWRMMCKQRVLNTIIV